MKMAELSSSSLDISATTNDNRRLACSLKEALDTVIKKTVREIKFSIIKNHYSEIFNENPESLRKLHQEICSQLNENIKLEISKICEDENIETLLNSLDDIILQNAEYEGQVAWRPSGDPHEDLTDSLYELKIKHKDELDKMLKELNEENEILSNTVEKNHREILQAESENGKFICDLKKTVSVLQDSLVDVEQRLISSSILYED